jgi:hypothetical protein
MADNSKPIVAASLDDFLQNTAAGSAITAIGNNFYGINHRQTPTPIALNKDNYGLTFFVRPQLNMQKVNLRNHRLFTPLLSNEASSYQTIIRCLLDPRIIGGYPGGIEEDGGEALATSDVYCPFVDNTQAFIPVLTNHLKSISGWPDVRSPILTSKEGAYQETHSMVDGIAVNYTAYDIDATFRSSRGDPIMSLFYYWVHYMSAVFEGTLLPYPDMIVENEIDYQTRIYRLVLDSEKRFVQKIGATGVCIPTNIPIGGAFDFSTEKPYNNVDGDITIQFKCNGAIYQDDILIQEFNKTVAIFNPSMDDGRFDDSTGLQSAEFNSPIKRDMMKIDRDHLALFNNRGYPYINPNTYELGWYVSKQLYAQKLQSLQEFRNSF